MLTQQLTVKLWMVFIFSYTYFPFPQFFTIIIYDLGNENKLKRKKVFTVSVPEELVS